MQPNDPPAPDGTMAAAAPSDACTDPFTGPIDPAAAVQEALARVDARAREVDASLRRFVVERPLVAIVGALAGGYVIGRLLSR